MTVVVIMLTMVDVRVTVMTVVVSTVVTVLWKPVMLVGM